MLPRRRLVFVLFALTCSACLVQAGDNAANEADTLYPVKVDDKYGFMDRSGMVRIPATYDDAKEFSEGVALVREGLKRRFIDVRGKVVFEVHTEFTLRRVGSFHDGLAWVAVVKLFDKSIVADADNPHKERYGYVDKHGKWIIAPTLRTAGDFSEGRALVKDEQKNLKYIDTDGKVIFEVPGHRAEDFCSGRAAFTDDRDLWGLIDRNGKVVTQPRFRRSIGFNGDLMIVYNDDDGYRIVGKGGKVLKALKFKYEFVAYPQQGLLMFAERGGKIGYMDYEGKIQFYCPPGVDDAGPFSSGLAPVRQGATEKWGFIDRKGRLAIPYGYDEVQDFRGALTRVSIGKQWHYIDRTGKRIEPVLKGGGWPR